MAPAWRPRVLVITPVKGGSRTIEFADRSAVGRSLIGKPWLLIALLDPGSTRAVVTPPATDDLEASSSMYRRERSRWLWGVHTHECRDRPLNASTVERHLSMNWYPQHLSDVKPFRSKMGNTIYLQAQEPT